MDSYRSCSSEVSSPKVITTQSCDNSVSTSSIPSLISLNIRPPENYNPNMSKRSRSRMNRNRARVVDKSNGRPGYDSSSHTNNIDYSGHNHSNSRNIARGIQEFAECSDDYKQTAAKHSKNDIHLVAGHGVVTGPTQHLNNESNTITGGLDTKGHLHISIDSKKDTDRYNNQRRNTNKHPGRNSYSDGGELYGGEQNSSEYHSDSSSDDIDCYNNDEQNSSKYLNSERNIKITHRNGRGDSRNACGTRFVDRNENNDPGSDSDGTEVSCDNNRSENASEYQYGSGSDDTQYTLDDSIWLDGNKYPYDIDGFIKLADMNIKNANNRNRNGVKFTKRKQNTNKEDSNSICDKGHPLPTNRKNSHEKNAGHRLVNNSGSTQSGKHGIAPRTHSFSYEKLELLSRKEAHEIIPVLMNPESGFEEMLNDLLTNVDWLFRIMDIAYIICISEFVANRNCVLYIMCESALIEHLSTYIGEMPIEGDRTRIDYMPIFVESVVTFFDTVVNSLPTTAAANRSFNSIIRRLAISVSNIEQHLQVKIKEAVSQKLQKLMLIIDHCSDVQKELPKNRTLEDDAPLRSLLLGEMDAPGNFRTLSLYPLPEDLKRGGMGFVRPNIVSGKYKSVEHYLDVQFRLLREDFLSPLREGIQEYIKSHVTDDTKYKYKNVRFYRDVKFLRSTTSTHNDVGYIVKFDQKKKLQHINWNYSKRLMYGSLLVFTSDEFDTFFLATVLQRDAKMLRSGEITVTTLGSELNEQLFGKSYTMAESEVFYEPYNLVMRALIQLDERSLPMQQYIVNADMTPALPDHIINQPRWKIENCTFYVDNVDWPSAAQLKLDDSQYDAFRHALSKKFCVIQGPPGTGKTYLGLKITKAFIENLELTKLPILVVCYTNHALDQFLEGCLKFTTSIVRIGGQSESEILKQYNLRCAMNNDLARQLTQGMIGKLMFYARQDMQKLMTTLELKEKDREEIYEPKGIISLSYIQPFMSEHHKSILKSDSDLIALLLDLSGITFVTTEDQVTMYYEHDVEEMRQRSNSFEVDSNDGENCEKGSVDKLNVMHDNDEIGCKSFKEKAMSNLKYACLTSSLEDQLNELQTEFDTLSEVEQYNGDDNKIQYLNNLHSEITHLVYKVDLIKRNARAMVKEDGKQSADSNCNLWKCSRAKRWYFYRYWVRQLEETIQQDIKRCEMMYRQKRDHYEEFKQMEDLTLVRTKKIIGMTTTGAARLQMLLKSMKPAIVIVEEAAEVLEAHIIVALTKECEHVVLIGDHKQLRPSAALFELSKNFNINVSLFERMINNGMEYAKLNMQHRMRSEISKIITPFIYPDLTDDPVVHQFPAVLGITKNMFFIDHQQYEESVIDSSSRRNIYEADFVISLCRYIILQGYKPADVTILTTYSGQVYYLREQKTNKYNNLLENVKISAVDKFQGEESDIVILSLVRSNEEKNIGFLSIENRVCVALTRAKIGLYIIGNMSVLSAASELWSNIKKVLEHNEAIGPSLMLHCPLHDKFTAVSRREDFHNVPEGGCNQVCNFVMACGHTCQKACHAVDRPHLTTVCFENCYKRCRNGHPCKGYCNEPCPPCDIIAKRTLKCGHKYTLECSVDIHQFKCTVPIQLKLPGCGHTVTKLCHEELEKVTCNEPCIWRLECGHACILTCHVNDDPLHLKYKCKKPCDKLNAECSNNHKCLRLCHETCGMCPIAVMKVLSCGHQTWMECSADTATMICQEPCENICPSCKIPCPKSCFQNCAPCTQMVTKTIPTCGHTIEISCSEEPDPTQCKAKCRRLKPCSHPCESVCGISCHAEKCLVPVESSFEAACGHGKAVTPCYISAEGAGSLPVHHLMKFCRNPCRTLLKCGDLCSGTCGECYQGRLHKTCDEKCGNMLICGHKCDLPCREICPPCTEQCSYSCIHSKCSRRCGEPCIRCQEPCAWVCIHKKCTRKCWELCNRSACNEPCQKRLRCGHFCIGFCGEPCPPLCRVCDREELTTILFGQEDDPNARFVLLQDCKHTVESNGLNYFLSSSAEGGEIIQKTCPLCKTPITKTLRYMDHVKKTYQHIINIKKKVYGDDKRTDKVRMDILHKLRELSYKKAIFQNLGWQKISQHVDRFFEKLNSTFTGSTSTWRMSSHQVAAIQYYVDFFEMIALRAVDRAKISKSNWQPVEEWVNLMLDRIADAQKINPQQGEDINYEVRRFYRLVDFAVIRSKNDYPSQLAETITGMLHEPARYTMQKDAELDRLLEELRAMSNIQPLTLEEKHMLNEAMAKDFYSGLSSKGHWFQCPNGHYYVITECGGAMEMATCPDCGELIGGMNHRYLPTSQLAGEFDGARHPAWSEANNMENFLFM